MERLRKTAEWAAPQPQPYELDYYREHHFPVIEISPSEAKTTQRALQLGSETLLQLAEYRNITPDQMWTAYDVDYVLRNPPHQLLQLCPGRLPQGSITTLKQLENRGVQIAAFATNQPLDGHQVARFVGSMKNYPPILETLKENFPQAEIISAGRDWSFAWQRPKNSHKNVSRLSEMIRQSDSELFAFFGDRQDIDAEFWRMVQEQVPEKGNKFAFVKLPNPAVGNDLLTRVLPLIP